MKFTIWICFGILALAACTVRVEAQSTYLGMDRNDYPGNAAMKTLREYVRFYRVLVEQSAGREPQQLAREPASGGGNRLWISALV